MWVYSPKFQMAIKMAHVRQAINLKSTWCFFVFSHSQWRVWFQCNAASLGETNVRLQFETHERYYSFIIWMLKIIIANCLFSHLNNIHFISTNLRRRGKRATGEKAENHFIYEQFECVHTKSYHPSARPQTNDLIECGMCVSVRTWPKFPGKAIN